MLRINTQDSTPKRITHHQRGNVVLPWAHAHARCLDIPFHNAIIDSTQALQRDFPIHQPTIIGAGAVAASNSAYMELRPDATSRLSSAKLRTLRMGPPPASTHAHPRTRQARHHPSSPTPPSHASIHHPLVRRPALPHQRLGRRPIPANTGRTRRHRPRPPTPAKADRRQRQSPLTARACRHPDVVRPHLGNVVWGVVETSPPVMHSRIAHSHRESPWPNASPG